MIFVSWANKHEAQKAPDRVDLCACEIPVIQDLSDKPLSERLSAHFYERFGLVGSRRLDCLKDWHGLSRTI